MNNLVARTAAAVAMVALMLFAFAGAATAQTDYVPVNPQLPYDGPFSSNAPLTATTGALGFDAVDAQPGTSDGTVGGTGGGLATTGSDINVPVIAAISLMAVGGLVLVTARRRDI